MSERLIEWDAGYQSDSAVRRHLDRLRSANPDFAAIHSMGFDRGKRMAADGWFNACATCNHERISHYDGTACGEDNCPMHCTEFA